MNRESKIKNVIMNYESISFSTRSSELKDIDKTDGSDNGEESNKPDYDTIKMFVGQIPKTWDESKLKEFFEQYGPVYHLNILREKETDNSRGCCFVTFYHRKDAINAQNALHNIFIMPGLSHPVQMKPADIENRNDRKLFVGMLSKTMVEEDVRNLFKEYGHIEELSILKENGKSKGCAFLTFVNRSCAQRAIKNMNQSKIFEGCTKPVVVKFADSGREKLVKKVEENRSGNSGETNSQQNQLISTQQQSPSSVEVLTNLVSLLQQPGLVTLLESARILQQLQQSNQQSLINSATNLNASTNNQSSISEFKPFAQLPTHQHPIHQKQSIQHYSQSNISVQTTAPNLLNITSTPSLLFQSNLLPNLTNYPFATTYPTIGFQSTLNQLSPTNVQPYTSNMALISPPINQRSNIGPEKNSRGPDGCNLFVYHLPQEFTDTDLYATFCNFGNILSAKVFIDKQTNLSKCFGFVSYSDEESAQNAINGMNGHQIGNKRLKVQLKRSEKPYDKPSGN